MYEITIARGFASDNFLSLFLAFPHPRLFSVSLLLLRKVFGTCEIHNRPCASSTAGSIVTVVIVAVTYYK